MSQKVDMNGTKLKVAFNQIPPFIFLSNGSNQGLLEGYEVDMLYELANYLNFTIELVDCDMNWGNPLENNTWDGLTGLIQNKQVDFGIGEISMTRERMEAISFTYPHIISGVTFTAPLPESRGYSTSLFTPFESNVWILLLSTIFIQLLLNLFLKQMFFKMESLRSLNWNILMIIMSQPIHLYLKFFKTLVRLLTFGWLLSSFVLRTSYGGCLYSSMARHEEPHTIETLYELAEGQAMGTIQVISPEGDSYVHSFKNSKNEIMRGIGQNMKTICSFDNCCEMLKNDPGHYALIEMENWLEFCIKYHKLPYYLPPLSKDSVIFLDFISIGIPKNFEYQEQFNRIISSFIYGGLILYWKDRCYYERLRIPRSAFDKDQVDIGEWKILSLDQIDDVFQVFLIVYCTSLILLAIEVFHWIGPRLFYEKLKSIINNLMIKIKYN